MTTRSRPARQAVVVAMAASLAACGSARGAVPSPTEATTSTISVTTSITPSLSDALVGHQWVQMSTTSPQILGTLRPIVSFTTTGDLVRVVSSDGCNEMTVTGHFVGDGFTVADTAASANAACSAIGTGAAGVPGNGDRLTVSTDGTDYTLVAHTTGFGVVTSVFRRLDRIGGTATASQLAGTWSLAPGAEQLGLSPNGDLLVGLCHWTWRLDADRLVTGDTTSDPHTCNSNASATFAHLIDEFTHVRPPTVGIDDGGALWITGDSFAFRMAAAGPAPDLSGVQLGVGRIFGLAPGDVTNVDRVVAQVSQSLGPITRDTGWYDVPATTGQSFEDCYGGRTYRVLWWGRVRLAFWRYDAAGLGMLWNWSIGDRNVMYLDKTEPGAPPADPGTILEPTNELAIRVGARDTSLPAAQVGAPTTGSLGITLRNVVSSLASGGVYVGVRRGVIVGYGAQLVFC